MVHGMPLPSKIGQQLVPTTQAVAQQRGSDWQGHLPNKMKESLRLLNNYKVPGNRAKHQSQPCGRAGVAFHQQGAEEDEKGSEDGVALMLFYIFSQLPDRLR